LIILNNCSKQEPKFIDWILDIYKQLFFKRSASDNLNSGSAYMETTLLNLELLLITKNDKINFLVGGELHNLYEIVKQFLILYKYKNYQTLMIKKIHNINTEFIYYIDSLISNNDFQNCSYEDHYIYIPRFCLNEVDKQKLALELCYRRFLELMDDYIFNIDKIINNYTECEIDIDNFMDFLNANYFDIYQQNINFKKTKKSFNFHQKNNIINYRDYNNLHYNSNFYNYYGKMRASNKYRCMDIVLFDIKINEKKYKYPVLFKTNAPAEFIYEYQAKINKNLQANYQG